MNVIDHEKLAEEIAQRVNKHRLCTICTTTITRDEHEQHHQWWKKWIEPLTIDLAAVGRRIILFAIFAFIILGVATMIGFGWLLNGGIKFGIMTGFIKGPE